MKKIIVHCKCDRLVPATELKPDPQNPNHHPEAQLALYEKILRGTGWRRAVVVSNRSGCITKGHGAVLAALRIGCEVPVDFQDYPDRKSEIADMLADKKLAEKSEFDDGAALELLADFTPEEIYLAAFSSGEVNPEITIKKLDIKPPPKDGLGAGWNPNPAVRQRPDFA